MNLFMDTGVSSEALSVNKIGFHVVQLCQLALTPRASGTPQSENKVD